MNLIINHFNIVTLYRLTSADLKILYPQAAAFRVLKGLLKCPVLNINLFIILYKFTIAVIDTIAKKVPKFFLMTLYSFYSG